MIRGSLVGLQYDVGAQAIYSCDQGYTLVGGTHLRQCDVDGTWSGSAPQCEPIRMYDKSYFKDQIAFSYLIRPNKKKCVSGNARV